MYGLAGGDPVNGRDPRGRANLINYGIVVAAAPSMSIAAGLVVDDIERHIEEKFWGKRQRKSAHEHFPAAPCPFRAALRSRRTLLSISTCALLCFAFLLAAFAEILPAYPAVPIGNHTDQHSERPSRFRTTSRTRPTSLPIAGSSSMSPDSIPTSLFGTRILTSLLSDNFTSPV